MIDNLRAGPRETDGRDEDREQTKSVWVVVEEEIARDQHHHQIRTGEIYRSRTRTQKKAGHFIRRSSNVWGYRYVVVCQWTCYPRSGSHYDCTHSPLHEQGQSASPEKKTQRQTRTQTWSREQAREKSHYHAMWKKWNGKDSGEPDRMAAVSVRNASDLEAGKEVAERGVEESSAKERSAAVEVARAHGRANVYYSCMYSYAVNQARAVGVFEGAGDRGDEAQGTTTREFAGLTRIRRRRRVQRAMVVRLVGMMMMMCAEIDVSHCSCCCSGRESGGKRQ